METSRSIKPLTPRATRRPLASHHVWKRSPGRLRLCAGDAPVRKRGALLGAPKYRRQQHACTSNGPPRDAILHLVCSPPDVPQLDARRRRWTDRSAIARDNARTRPSFDVPGTYACSRNLFELILEATRTPDAAVTIPNSPPAHFAQIAHRGARFHLANRPGRSLGRPS